MFGGGSPGSFLIDLLNAVLDVYSFVILLRALMSWFSPHSFLQLYLLLIRITEPVLAPLRRIIPVQGVDFSPIIAILLIDLVVKRLLVGLLRALFNL